MYKVWWSQTLLIWFLLSLSHFMVLVQRFLAYWKHLFQKSWQIFSNRVIHSLNDKKRFTQGLVPMLLKTKIDLFKSREKWLKHFCACVLLSISKYANSRVIDFFVFNHQNWMEKQFAQVRYDVFEQICFCMSKFGIPYKKYTVNCFDDF